MRDFGRTSEPEGGEATELGNSFVVQKHDASHLHYDFRLEHEGVLLSWSIPKGPSLKAGERRLAVRTEDHPMSYASFEGIIPKGEYGGGTVIVWDRGTWTPEEDAAKQLGKGKLTFTLAGEKLRGRFHLVKTKPAGKHEQWLLFKGRDQSATTRDVTVERPESVLTGRSIEEVAEAPARVWHSNRGGAGSPSTAMATAESKSKTTTKSKTTSTSTSTTKSTSTSTSKSKSKSTSLSTSGDVLELVKKVGTKTQFSNLEKVLYPESGLRKGDVIAYYAAVSSRILPHLRGRPLTLVRCPSGRTAHCFFQKHANQGVPEAVHRVPIVESGKKLPYMMVDDLDGLLALPQLGALELHTWPAHVQDVEKPDQLVFDLDPDQGLGWDAVVEAAFRMRDALAALELESFVKTTGGKGLHVVLPVARKHDWDTHRDFARGVADALARAQPKLYLTNMRKDLRKGKLFLDYLRNGRGATAVAPYSTRAREGATVATPLSWQELERGVDPKAFNVRTLMKRIDDPEDPWAAYARTKQKLTAKQRRAVGV